MVMHALLFLAVEVFGEVEIGVLGWFDQIGVDFEGKSSKRTVVNASSSEYVFLDILSQSLDD